MIEILQRARTVYSLEYDRSNLITKLNNYLALLNNKQDKLNKGIFVIPSVGSPYESPKPPQSPEISHVSTVSIQINPDQLKRELQEEALLNMADKISQKIESDPEIQSGLEQEQDLLAGHTVGDLSKIINLKGLIEQNAAEKLKAENLKSIEGNLANLTQQKEQLKREDEQRRLQELRKQEEEQRREEQLKQEQKKKDRLKILDEDMDAIEANLAFLKESEKGVNIEEGPDAVVLKPTEEDIDKEDQEDASKHTTALMMLNDLDHALDTAQKQVEKEILKRGHRAIKNNKSDLDTVIETVKGYSGAYSKFTKLNDAIKKHDAILKLREHTLSNNKNAGQNAIERLESLRQTYQTGIDGQPIQDTLNPKIHSKIRRALEFIGRILSKPIPTKVKESFAIPKKVKESFVGKFFTNPYKNLDKQIKVELENAENNKIIKNLKGSSN